MLKRLTESHPTFEKIRKLETLADDLSLRLHKTLCGFDIEDRENGITVAYMDLEQGFHCYDHAPDSFPSPFETKLIIEE